MSEARVSPRGADRWRQGHPWIYRSDVLAGPDQPGVVTVREQRGRVIGRALWSPASEIRLRLLDRRDVPIDAVWWRERLLACQARRAGIDASAYRLVHAEGDLLPSLIVDRYDRWLVVQLLSAGLETMREIILDALVEVAKPEGILLRNDVGVRRHEGLAEEVVEARGSVPHAIEVREGGIRFLAAPWDGQKTGAFLDQRDNRLLAGGLMPPGGRALDCFAYHGSFALHLAARAREVVALDVSGPALARGRENAELNGLDNIAWLEADAFEQLRRWERERERFDVVVVDPPAFAKSRSTVPAALRGYREINLRAMRLLSPGGALLTASCSWHVNRALFLEALAGAAADSGRNLRLVRILAQAADHPELITVPETGYLKGAVLRAADPH